MTYVLLLNCALKLAEEIILSVCLFITLYMFQAHSAHHQEREIVSIQPLVTIILRWWPSCVQVGSSHQHRMIFTRGCIDTISLS